METRTQALRFAGGSFDPLRGELRIGDHRARLRPRSASVLALLMDERGRVVGRDELMRHVWPDVVVTDDSLAQCIKEVRRALGPASECIRTIPRVGYAFADAQPEDPEETRAAVEPAEPTAIAQPAAEPAPTTRARRAAAGPRRLVAAFALALVALVGLGLSLMPASRNAPPFSVVVLPLATVGGDAARDDVADGITRDLTTDLSLIPGTFVIARSTADSYRGRTIDARGIGRELGVRYVVEGSVQRFGTQVMLNLSLVDAQADGIVWSERFDGLHSDLGTLQRRVTARIARTLQLELIEDEAARTKRHPSVSPDEALELFRAQIRENPGYAPAWMWAAIAHTQLGDYSAAIANAEQAIRLSPHDARLPYFYSVLSRARLYGGDAAGALAAAEQAARSPGPNRYAPLLVVAAAMGLGETERARHVMAEFVARNPGYSAASLRTSRPLVGPSHGEREEHYIAALVAAGLPER